MCILKNTLLTWLYKIESKHFFKLWNCSLNQACRFALILATHAKKISGKLSFWEISLSFWEIFLSFKKNSLLWRHCCYIGVPIFFRNIEFLKNILEFFEKIAWVLVFLEFFIAWVFFENAKRQAWASPSLCRSKGWLWDSLRVEAASTLLFKH